jgi:hypothetical protein
MNRIEHILDCVAEECGEVTQRAMKAARFGLSEIQPGKTENNAKRLMAEFHDLLGAMELLAEESNHVDLHPYPADRRVAIEAKKDRIRTYMVYAAEQGTLTEETK